MVAGSVAAFLKFAESKRQAFVGLLDQIRKRGGGALAAEQQLLVAHPADHVQVQHRDHIVQLDGRMI